MNDANPFYLVRGLTQWRLPALPEQSPEFHPESVGSFDEALKAILDDKDGCCVVSCDLFDTLLQRDVAPAEFIHEITARHLRHLLLRHGRDIEVEALLTLRRSITSDLAAQGHEGGRHGEYRLAELLQALCQKLWPEDPILACAFAEASLAFELEQERRRTGPVPGAIEFLARLKKHCRVLCITDTPLDGESVQHLIDNAGLAQHIDRVYVSSELGANKRSGTLFDAVLATENIPATEIRHVGDNPLTDFIQPRSRGITSLLLQHRELFNQYEDFKRRLNAARTFGCPEYLRDEEPTDGSPAFLLGRKNFSLAFALFALQILELDREHGFDKIYFVARDGYLPHQSFLRLTENLADALAASSAAKADYLHLSRASTLCPTDEASLDEALRYSTLVHGRKAIPSFFATLGLDVDAYEAALNEAGFNPEDMESASLETLARLRQSLSATETPLANQLASDLKNKRAGLTAYLTSKGFFSAKKVLLVDAGWRYRIAHNLEAALGDRPDFPQLHCALLGYTDELPLKRGMVHPGFLFDARRANPLEKLLVQHREIIETIASACEGSCIGYDEQGRALLRPGYYGDELRADLQAGILAGVRDFATDYRRFQTGAEFQTQATLQLLWPIQDRTHPLHSVLAELLLPDAGATASSQDVLADNPTAEPVDELGSFVSGISSRIEVNLGKAGKDMAPPTQNLEKLLGLIQKAMSSDKPIILWGLGLIGKLIYPHLVERISHIVDMDATLHGTMFGRHRVAPPGSLPNSAWENHVVVFTPLTRATPSVLANRADVLLSADWLS